jgi:hypothetical protein
MEAGISGIRLEGVDPNEIRIVVNNLGMDVGVFAQISEGLPAILYFGDVPRSFIPPILMSLHLFKDEKGNKCVVFCGLVIEYDGKKIPIELKIPAKDLKSFLHDYIIFDFCNKVVKIEDGNIICDRRRFFLAPNAISKDYVRRLIEEMKNPGNEDEAYDNFQEKYEYPPCFKTIP